MAQVVALPSMFRTLNSIHRRKTEKEGEWERDTGRETEAVDQMHTHHCIRLYHRTQNHTMTQTSHLLIDSPGPLLAENATGGPGVGGTCHFLSLSHHLDFTPHCTESHVHTFIHLSFTLWKMPMIL